MALKWMPLRLNLRKKLTVTTAAVMLFAVFAVSSINHFRYTEYFLRQTNLQTGQLLEQAGINVDTYLDELFRLTMSPYYDNDIMRLLDIMPQSDAEKLDKTRRIEAFLGSVMTIPRTDILRVYIFTEDGIYSNEKAMTTISPQFDSPEADWYQAVLDNEEPLFLPVRNEIIPGLGETRLFSIAMKLRSKTDNTRVVGVIRVDANYNGIQSICDKVRLPSGGGLYIADSTGNLIYQNGTLKEESLDVLFALAEEGSSDRIRLDGQPFLLNFYSLHAADWILVAVNDYSDIDRYAAMTRNAAAAVAALCAGATILLLFTVLKRFLNPLHQVVVLMKEVEEGSLNVRYQGINKDEIGYLGDSFNHMLDQLEKSIDHNTRLLREVYEVQLLEKETRLDLLYSQIRPHFLYNALSTISLLVKCNQAAQAAASIEYLSIYLRGIMSSDREIPLRSELKIIDAYLAFQQIRYGSKLNYEISVESLFFSFTLPALILQPLVENAVVHGSEEVSTAVWVRVYTLREDNAWLLCVEDDAGGIDTGLLDKLRERIACQTDESDEDQLARSIGIVNVQKRIALKFGSSYGITLESELRHGTKVTIRLPYPEEEVTIKQEGKDVLCNDCR